MKNWRESAMELFYLEAPVIQRATVWGKAVAGGIRCFFEDVYSGGLQLIYLCKIWPNKNVSGATKAFTMVSVITSGFCSLVGPLAARYHYYMLSDAAKSAEDNYRYMGTLRAEYIEQINPDNEGNRIKLDKASTVEDMIERPRAHVPLVIASVIYWSSANCGVLLFRLGVWRSIACVGVVILQPRHVMLPCN